MSDVIVPKHGARASIWHFAPVKICKAEGGGSRLQSRLRIGGGGPGPSHRIEGPRPWHASCSPGPVGGAMRTTTVAGLTILLAAAWSCSDSDPGEGGGTGTAGANASGGPLAPLTNNGTLAVEVGSSRAGRLVASDDDGDALTYRIVTPPREGTLSAFDPATGAYTYTTARMTAGSDLFTFQANDGTADAPAEGAIAVIITPFDFTGWWSLADVTRDGHPCDPTSFTVDHH